MRLAAAEVIAHYALLRSQLVSHMLEGTRPDSYSRFFSPSDLLDAQLLTLPGTEELVEFRRRMTRAVKDFHADALSGDSTDVLDRHRQPSLEAIRAMEAAVRDLVANAERMRRRE